MAHPSLQFGRNLLKSRRIFLWDDIDDESAKSIIQQIKYLWRKSNEQPIYLYIHSDGGFVDAGLAIIDEIQAITEANGEFYTICNGKACSAAAYILAMGTPGYRYATPNSTIMLHSVSADMGNDKLHEHKGYIDYSTKQQDDILKMMAKACGKSSAAKFKKFSEDVKNTIWLNSRDAVKYGLIDGIWKPSDEHGINEQMPSDETDTKNE